MPRNPMKGVTLEKAVLSIGLGRDLQDVDKAAALAEKLTGKRPVRTRATRRARTFKVARSRDIGVKVTVRGGSQAKEFLAKVLPAVDNTIKKSSFDEEGNFGFGVREYLQVPGMKYDPSIGIMGFNVNVALSKPGFRVKRRKLRKTKIPRKHRVMRDEAVEYASKELGVKVV